MSEAQGKADASLICAIKDAHERLTGVIERQDWEYAFGWLARMAKDIREVQGVDWCTAAADGRHRVAWENVSLGSPASKGWNQWVSCAACGARGVLELPSRLMSEHLTWVSFAVPDLLESDPVAE